MSKKKKKKTNTNITKEMLIEWDVITERLRNSGCDLSKIELVSSIEFKRNEEFKVSQPII